MEKKYFAIDFDGTLYKGGEYGNIGSPNWEIINACKKLQSKGHCLILNTCRENEDLQEAIDWCKDKGLLFDYINENCPELINKWKKDSRKIGADYYLDDRNISFLEFIKMANVNCKE